MPASLAPRKPVGRYAPSPTGALHFGSLVAALASYAHARSRGTAWVMRMEDIDPKRAVPGAADDILRTLEAFGLTWDGPVLYQSTRTPAYREAIDSLRRAGAVFDCGCTRKEARTGPMGEEGPIYPGTCRAGLPAGRMRRSLRLRVPEQRQSFADGVLGCVQQDLATAVGDFIIRRADGRAAYQLAVVVDDAYQGVTEVVRGADLLASTPRQMLLQSLLQLAHPDYWHVPLLLDHDGRKLGKSSRSPPVSHGRPAPLLVQALQILGQQPPSGLAEADTETVRDWAVRHWAPARIPRQAAVTIAAGAQPAAAADPAADRSGL